MCTHMCMSCFRTEMGLGRERQQAVGPRPPFVLLPRPPEMIEVDLSHSHRPGLMSKGWVLGMFSHHSFCSLCKFQPQKWPHFSSFTLTHLSTEGGTSGWRSTQPISAAGSAPALPSPPPSLPLSSPHCLQEQDLHQAS